MKISVIIPAYNEEDYIGKTLSSLNHQTIKPDEVIVVDNNSRDHTAQIAKKLGAKVVKETKQGMIYARNKGFDSAKYEIIARCDADVILPSTWIETIISDFKNVNLDALSGPVIYYDSYLKYFGSFPSRLYLWALRLLTGGQSVLVGLNMVITKDIWHKVKDSVCLDDKLVHEDVDLSLHIQNIGGQIRNDNSLIVKTSSRRIMKRPDSFFLEYPLRMIKTFRLNR